MAVLLLGGLPSAVSGGSAASVGQGSARASGVSVELSVAPAASWPAGSFGLSAPSALSAGSSALPSAAAVARTFAVDVYRSGVFTTQATWWYCTAASVQIMRNIDRGQADHSAAAQTHYFNLMRANNLHRMPVTDGIDPPGFLAGLRTFVDSRYRLVASTTFDNAVRSAVSRLRTSGMPVALIVDRGRHAWVLTGFTATADPAKTRAFRVLSVRIVGPLYGRQSRNGYDPAPDTSLSVDAFRRFLTPYDFKYGPTPWDDRFVTFQVPG
jgi:hypothetical protein